MLKRRFYKQDHGDKDNVSDSSSSSSDSDSEVESQEEIQASEEEELTTETLSEPIRPYVSSSSNSSAARYDSGDSSENEVDFEPSDGARNGGEDFSCNQLSGKGKFEAVDTKSVEADFGDCILKRKSVYKCRVCPRVVCLTEESLKSHLKSKRHVRSKKLLNDGKLKVMLNSDGEIEEDPETHAERHARTLSVAQDLANKSKKKNKGRQRQRLRLKDKKMTTEEKLKKSVEEPTNKSAEKPTKKSAEKPAKKKQRNKE